MPIMAINVVKYSLAGISGALLVVPMVVVITRAIKKKRLNEQANATDDNATNWISNETTPLIS